MIPDSAIGAFFGAFFAFVFGLLTYYITKWVERQSRDYNSMVKLEGILNEHLNIFAKNEYLIHGSIDTLRRGFMTYNILRKYRIAEDLELDFLDPELINNYFDYRDSIISLNHDFEVSNHANGILRELVLSNKANSATIKANSDNLAVNLESLNNMASVMDEETKKLLCKIRIKIKLDEIGALGINRWFCWKPHQPTKNEVKKEMIKLESEIAKTKESSAKLILKSFDK